MEEIVQQALTKGVEMHVAGKFEVASQLYGSVIKLQPNHADANHNMGLLQVDTENSLEALPYLKTALEADTSIAQFWLSYINVLIKLERLDEAVRILNLAKESGIECEEFLELQEQLNQLPRADVVDSPEEDGEKPANPNILDTLKLDKALRLAKQNLKDGSPDEAKRIYLDILVKFPKNKKAIDGIKTLSGEPIGKKNKTQDPPRDILQNIGSHFNQGSFQIALDYIAQSLKQFPKSPVLYDLQGAANNGLGLLENAVKSYKKAIVIKPDFSEGYYNLGVILQSQGKLQEAVEVYKKAVSIKPNKVSAYSNMGVVLQEQGELKEAIEAFKKALSLQPNHASAYNNIVEFLKTCSPNQQRNHYVFQIDRKVKKIGEKLLITNSDKELVKNLSEALDVISIDTINFKTPLSQIYRRNAGDLNCKRHIKIFETQKIIPEFCFKCFKVQVEVNTILELVKLTALLYKFEFEENLTSKTFIELRPNISGFYKGLVYCRGIDQAKKVKKLLDIDLKKILQNEKESEIKRGCSEFPLRYPEYGEIEKNTYKTIEYPKEWKPIEDQFDKNHLIKGKQNLLPSLPEFCLSDFYIIRKWIDYARGLQDPSCHLFEDKPILFQDIYEAAVLRKSKLRKTFKKV